LNPDLKLPDMDIVVAHRTDGSGTTYIFTDYLSAVSKTWADKVGKNTSVSWPVGLGGKGSEGVSGLVKQTPGCIGYVELIYALQNKLPVGDVKNAAGKFITPSLKSVSDALATATIPDDFRFSYVNAPGDTSYPISGVTWLLVYANQTSNTQGTALVKFLKWVFTEGQKMEPAMFYAPMPDNVDARILKRIDEIKVPEAAK
jgi:phosphate transport system substrate-binding protein